MPVVNLDESCVLHRWHVPTASPLFLSWMPGRWEKRCGGCFWMRPKNLSIPHVSEWEKKGKPLNYRKEETTKTTNEFCAVACDRCDLYTCFYVGNPGTSFHLRSRVGLPTKIFRGFVPSITLKGGSTRIGSLIHPKFNSSPLKNDGWKMILPFRKVTFQGLC